MTLLLFKLIILIVASISYTTSSQDSQTRVCKTAGCLKAAKYILKHMDRTIDPCENFYQFACGQYIKNTIIPEDQASISLFVKSDDIIKTKLKRSIEKQITDDDPQTFKLLKSTYDICLNDEQIENTSIQQLKQILNKLGNWPVLVGSSWNKSKFDWKKIIYKLRRIGFTSSINSIVNFNINPDDKNNTRYIINLDQAYTGIKQEYLSKGREQKVVQAYYKYMTDLAEILGAERNQTEMELSESLNFEIELAKISLASGKRKDHWKLYNIKTVKQLQLDYPYIPWKRYLNELLSPKTHIDLSKEVNVKVPSYFKSLSRIISKTPKRVLANYLIWRVVQESSFYLNDQVRTATSNFQASIVGTKVQKPRWIRCVNNMLNFLPIATGALYVRKNFDRRTKRDVEDLVNEVRQSFDGILRKVDWMDEKSKLSALKKLKALYASVAYPNELYDNSKLDEYFEGLKINPSSFLKTNLQLKLFNYAHKIANLGKVVNKTSWTSHSQIAMFNAFYSQLRNSLEIPAGILQDYMFSNSRPSYMNYGAVGWIIGHEFTHGFDDQGSQYDNNGNLANWWDDKTNEEFYKRSRCIVRQYNNYSVEEVGLHVIGENTLSENIADNGGIKEAYYAYENYEKRHGEESKLPGLPYNSRQMFWISAANTWCGKFRPEALTNRILTDPHTPVKYRVIGSFSNMPEFSRDFHCPIGSPMNPVDKCVVW